MTANLYQVLDEQEQWERRALAEDNRECIYCNADISRPEQEKNGGSCNACADKAERAHWDQIEAGAEIPINVPW